MQRDARGHRYGGIGDTIQAPAANVRFSSASGRLDDLLVAVGTEPIGWPSVWLLVAWKAFRFALTSPMSLYRLRLTMRAGSSAEECAVRLRSHLHTHCIDVSVLATPPSPSPFIGGAFRR